MRSCSCTVHSPRCCSLAGPPHQCCRLTRHAQCRSRCRSDQRHALCTAASSAAAGTALPVWPGDEAAAATAEYRQLCHLQLQLLVQTLQLSMQAPLAGSRDEGDSSSSSSTAVVPGVAVDLMGPGAWLIRAAVYLRKPSSLQTGQLELAQVAASDGRAPHLEQCLMLGEEQAGSMRDQEAWLIQQPAIALPDSGGLVLPLAHSGFLVGLLIVERSAQPSLVGTVEPVVDEQAQGRWDSLTAGSQAAATDGGQLPPQAALPPPACALLGPRELALLRQAAGVLAAACAMELRTVLERAASSSVSVRQAAAQELVREARAPLSTLRTLGAMLKGRLPQGEPDREMAEGILEQGQRLAEVVGALQAALHPPAVANAAAALRSGSGTLGGSLRPSPAVSADAAAAAMQQAEEYVPALPSPSIGADWEVRRPLPGLPSPSSSSSATTNGSVESTSADGSVESTSANGSAGVSSASPAGVDSTSILINGSSGSRPSAAPGPSSLGPTAAAPAAGAGTDLLNMLMPLLAAASNFAAISGVSLVLVPSTADADAINSWVGSVAGQAGSSSAGEQQQQEHPALHDLPTARVAVGAGVLRRMLSQLLDGVVACCTKGDSIRVWVKAEQWEERPGVVVGLSCQQGIQHGADGSLAASGRAAGGGSDPLLRAASSLRQPQLPEFAFLESMARQAGGRFDVYADTQPSISPDGVAPGEGRNGTSRAQHHMNRSTVSAVLWLPAAPTAAAAAAVAPPPAAIAT